jgi:hypothetical protein
MWQINIYKCITSKLVKLSPFWGSIGIKGATDGMSTTDARVFKHTQKRSISFFTITKCCFLI